MPMRCTVCDHPDAPAINEAIVLEGRSVRNIAAQYGVSYQSVQRHKDHIPKLLLQAKTNMDIYEAESILGRIEDLERETLAQLEAGKEDDDRRFVLNAIREQRHNLELASRVAQIIKEAPQINLIQAPEWVELRAVIINALAPYDDASRAVLGAIEGVSQQSIEGDR